MPLGQFNDLVACYQIAIMGAKQKEVLDDEDIIPDIP